METKGLQIPITAEILEKNRFKKKKMNNNFELFYTQSNKYIHIEYNPAIGRIDVNNNNWFTTNDIYYVDELQNALRCCGLWDLADSLKI